MIGNVFGWLFLVIAGVLVLIAAVMERTRRFDRWLVFGTAVILVAAAGAFFLIEQQSVEYRSWCEGQSGHVHAVGRGKLCASDDGRIIER